ncbi:MAG: MFS transporter [Oligoflexales bacterium]
MKEFITAPKDAWKFYLVNGAFAASRMGIGATSVVFMLSRGLKFSDVALIKIIQGVVVFFSEVPTGLVADTWGRKVSVLCACAAGVLSFFAFYSGNSLPWFVVGEIFNALTIAFWSGAFEALVVDTYRERSGEGHFLEFIFARMSVFEAGATMVGGLLGGYIGKFDVSWPFLFSASLMAITACLLLVLVKEPPQSIILTQVAGLVARTMNVLKKIETGFRQSVREGIQNPRLKAFFYIQISIQFALQPVFHYWQPYFTNLNLNVTTAELGFIFFGYVGTQLAAHWGVSELVRRQLVKPEGILFIEITLMTLGFFVMSVTQSYALAIGAFLVMQGSSGSLRNLLNASVNRTISSSQRATILSSISFISRVGMILSLLIVKWCLAYVSPSHLYLLSLSGSITLFPLYSRWIRASQNFTADACRSAACALP